VENAIDLIRIVYTKRLEEWANLVFAVRDSGMGELEEVTTTEHEHYPNRYNELRKAIWSGPVWDPELEDTELIELVSWIDAASFGELALQYGNGLIVETIVAFDENDRYEIRIGEAASAMPPELARVLDRLRSFLHRAQTGKLIRPSTPRGTTASGEIEAK
jgi:hypothetical protein